MKIYITAPYPERQRAVQVMRYIEKQGHEVTSRWLKEDDTLSDSDARKDLADVGASDVLLMLNPSGWENTGTGGRHVELGYAIALGKQLVLVGQRSNIFHYLSDITVLDRIEDFV